MKRIVLTERDSNIIDFLKTFRCATSSTIANIFFNGSLRPCNRRLQYLRENNLIKSSQDYISSEKVHYFNKKPSQLKHSCMMTKFISKLYENKVEILKLKKEYKIGNVRSDLLAICRIDGVVKIFMVEICNTKAFDINKYIRLKESNLYKDVFPVFPDIIVVSNKNYNSKIFNIINIDKEFNNFGKIKE